MSRIGMTRQPKIRTMKMVLGFIVAGVLCQGLSPEASARPAVAQADKTSRPHSAGSHYTGSMHRLRATTSRKAPHILRHAALRHAVLDVARQHHRVGPPVLCTVSLDATPYHRKADNLRARLFAPARHAVFFAHMERGGGNGCGRRHNAERS